MASNVKPEFEWVPSNIDELAKTNGIKVHFLRNSIFSNIFQVICVTLMIAPNSTIEKSRNNKNEREEITSLNLNSLISVAKCFNSKISKNCGELGFTPCILNVECSTFVR